uniref:alpha-L-fucosidase n=1 Tax=Phallusia mammillata TaxID=59560 RepID=A0A6F9DDQ2_9ASCI|nr:alpha-L-fucosidase [Phallusia mammillata]
MRLIAVLVILAVCATRGYGEYKPNWESLDTRPLPSWYDEAKLGIFIHWGVFSVPSFGDGFLAELFWYYWKALANPHAIDFMEKNYPPGFTYPDFAPQFTAEFFDPNKWADMFEASGAKYVVFTSKHGEGYTNWPSATSVNWNSMDVGPKRDIVGDLANAIKNRTSLRFGLYHNLHDFLNPLYLNDKQNNFTTNEFPRMKSMPELYDIVSRYKPDIVWSDGDQGTNSSYWNSAEFVAWLYNESPVKDIVVTNDRWGRDVLCKHGGFLTCDDRYNPHTLQTRKWENALTIDKHSWGYRRNANFNDFMSINELLQQLVTTISCNGNMLMNVGPTKEGTITPIFEERLRQMGEWLNVNGEAVYSSKPWKHQNDQTNKDVWYTMNGKHVYAFSFSWPDSNILELGSPISTSSASVDLVGGASLLTWQSISPGGVKITLPVLNPALTKAKWVYVFRLIGFV